MTSVKLEAFLTSPLNTNISTFARNIQKIFPVKLDLPVTENPDTPAQELLDVDDNRRRKEIMRKIEALEQRHVNESRLLRDMEQRRITLRQEWEEINLRLETARQTKEKLEQEIQTLKEMILN